MVEPEQRFQKKVLVSYEELVRAPIEEKLQLAKELEARLGRDEVLRTIEEMSVRSAIEGIRARAEAAHIRSLLDYGHYIEKRHERELTRNTQTIETLELSAERFHFQVKECLWAKVYRDLSASDYGLAFECCTDFPVCRVYHPALHLKRDKTLMAGDECCDFVYTWDKVSDGEG